MEGLPIPVSLVERYQKSFKDFCKPEHRADLEYARDKIYSTIFAMSATPELLDNELFREEVIHAIAKRFALEELGCMFDS